MAGVGIAITVTRGIEQLRFAADNWYYGKTSAAEIDRYGMMVASLYGLCLTTFLFAIRSGEIWRSPGKILAVLFASMCVLDWGLEAFAGAVTSYRISLGMPTESPTFRAAADSRGYIFGIWYRSFAPSIGYVVGLPLLAFVLFKTREQRASWRVVWLGFLGFDLLAITEIFFRASSSLPLSWRPWYFEMSIGLPLTLLAAALLNALFRRQHVDWWTTVVSVPLLLVWGTQIAFKSIAT